MQLEHKSLGGLETKAIDPDKGIVECFVSVTGIVDQVQDVIVPGAYAKTLAVRKPKGCFQHDRDNPVAKALTIEEWRPGDSRIPPYTARGEAWPPEAGVLYVKAQFNLDTEQGRRAFSDVRFFEEEQEWSIGYHVPRGGARIDHKSGIRYIENLDLIEFSPVLFGAAPLAGTMSVKGLVLGAEEEREVKVLAGSFEERIEKLTRVVRDALQPAPAGGDGGPDYVAWAEVSSTYPDRVIACQHQERGERQDWEIDYTMVAGEPVLGERRAVRIEHRVVPDVTPGEESYPEAAVAAKAYLSPIEILQAESLRLAL
jgi:hypothetical protein